MCAGDVIAAECGYVDRRGGRGKNWESGKRGQIKTRVRGPIWNWAPKRIFVVGFLWLSWSGDQCYQLVRCRIPILGEN